MSGDKENKKEESFITSALKSAYGFCISHPTVESDSNNKKQNVDKKFCFSAPNKDTVEKEIKLNPKKASTKTAKNTISKKETTETKEEKIKRLKKLYQDGTLKATDSRTLAQKIIDKFKL